MIRFALLLAFLALGGCSPAEAGTPPPPIPSPPPTTPPLIGRTETVLVRMPQVVNTYSNSSPPRNTVGVTLWGGFETLPSLPTSATSRDGVLDIVIDSASIPRNVSSRNGLGTVALGYSFSVPVSFEQYRYSYDIRVPRANWTSDSVAQVVSYFNFHDRVNNTSLWLGQIVFDTRCDTRGTVMWDQGTNTPMVNTKAPNFTCAPFGDWRSMSVTVGPERIAWATQQLRTKYPAVKLSSNPADYVLTHINLNPETARTPARIDVGVRNWQLVGIK